jgi:hypothetical protein
MSVLWLHEKQTSEFGNSQFVPERSSLLACVSRDQRFCFSMSFGTSLLQMRFEMKHLSGQNTIPCLRAHCSRDCFASRDGKYTVKFCNASSTQVVCFAVSTKTLSCLFSLTKQRCSFFICQIFSNATVHYFPLSLRSYKVS